MDIHGELADVQDSQPFGRYRLLEELGRGAMATVHRAIAVGKDDFSKLVAIKLIHPEIAAYPPFVQAFKNEAKLGGFLNHPNIISTLDYGEYEALFKSAFRAARIGERDFKGAPHPSSAESKFSRNSFQADSRHEPLHRA